MISAQEALARLREGNRRFVAGEGTRQTASSAELAALAEKQEPYAIIVGCADSRVPAEIVFDAGLGDLFVVRVAGNVVAPTQMGSVEFAALQFGSRLVVVLGHSGCGAVNAALGDLRERDESLSEGLRSVVDRVRPSVERALESGGSGDDSALLAAAVRANFAACASLLRGESAILKDLIENDGLRVVGAEYALETGEVDFFAGASLGG